MSGALGMYLSYWLDISSGATIVLLEAGAFVGAFAWSAHRGRNATWAPATPATTPGTQAFDDV